LLGVVDVPCALVDISLHTELCVDKVASCISDLRLAFFSDPLPLIEGGNSPLRLGAFEIYNTWRSDPAI